MGRLRLRGAIAAWTVASVLLGALATPASVASATAAAASPPTRLVVKLRPGAKLTVTRGNWEIRRAGLVTPTASSATDPAVDLRSLFTDSSTDGSLGSPLGATGSTPDLSRYVSVDARDATSADAVVAELARAGLVELWHPAPNPAPSPGTPDFAPRQRYAAGAPIGIGARSAWNVPGGRGEHVKIVDVEYAWNASHEDLPGVTSALIANGTPVDPFHDVDHGTAVLGVLASANNGLGVTGLSPAAALGLVNTHNVERGYDPANAINVARTHMGRGDVLLVEQQAYGPGTSLVPLEWIPEVYDAIRTATSEGIIVVEAAGNGGANLDDPRFGAAFTTGRLDSGAIVVGAGVGSNCGAVPRSRLSYSNYGSRVDVQGWGSCVVTAGYGDLANASIDQRYTATFGGTSSAAAVLGGAAAVISSVLEDRTNRPATPGEVRRLLKTTGAPQDTSTPGVAPGSIGPLPDVAAALGLPAVANPTVTPDVGVLGTTAQRAGYWMLGTDGSVFAFGDAQKLGEPKAALASPSGAHARAVKLEPVATGDGYWIADARGHVYAFGAAPWLGDASALTTGELVTSISGTPSSDGYWLFTNRGRVLTFGDARPFGDMSRVALQGPVLGSVATASGNGYYMVAADGGIFAFGDAAFSGSMGGTRLNAPVQSLVPDRDGAGYWLVASDGGIFAFDAPFRGSMGGTKLNAPITGMARYGDGYLMVGADGGVFDFSSQPFVGSLGDTPPEAPITSVAAR